MGISGGKLGKNLDIHFRSIHNLLIFSIFSDFFQVALKLWKLWNPQDSGGWNSTFEGYRRFGTLDGTILASRHEMQSSPKIDMESTPCTELGQICCT